MSFLTFKRSILIEYLIYTHILLITIQLAIRELVFDTTFIRDVFLIVILLLWSFRKKENIYSETSPKINYELWVKYLLGYGIIMSCIQIMLEISLLGVLLQFRNYFLPIFLFYVAKSTFITHKERARLTNFIYLLFILFIINVLLEYLVFKAGVSKYIFPWYSYQFEHSYRYITSQFTVPDQLNPEDSPIIGILGWAHATSATFFALFSFIIAFFINLKNTELSQYNLNPLNLTKWKINIIFILSLGVLIILGVKMQLVSIFILIVVIIYFSPRKLISKIIPMFIFSGIILAFTQQFWLDSFIIKYKTAFIGNYEYVSTISSILNWEIISNTVSSMLSISPAYIFFGGYDYTTFWFYPYLEIRLINFTLQFGLFWVILFLGLIFSTIRFCIKHFKLKKINDFDKTFALGALLLITSYFIDTLHYSRIMYWPNIDIFAVIIGALSNIKIEKDNLKISEK